MITFTHYKQANVTDVLHTEIIAIASFHLLSLVRLLVKENKKRIRIQKYIKFSTCKVMSYLQFSTFKRTPYLQHINHFRLQVIKNAYISDFASTSLFCLLTNLHKTSGARFCRHLKTILTGKF